MKRILRVIEYVGTDEFLHACVDNRQVKGTRTFPDGIIREAILGDTPEILGQDEFGPVVTTLLEAGLLRRKKPATPAGEGDLAP